MKFFFLHRRAQVCSECTSEKKTFQEGIVKNMVALERASYNVLSRLKNLATFEHTSKALSLNITHGTPKVVQQAGGNIVRVVQ